MVYQDLIIIHCYLPAKRTNLGKSKNKNPAIEIKKNNQQK